MSHMFHKENTCSMTREEIKQTASNLLKRMTLKEKVWMLNGNWDMIGNQLKYKNGYNPVPIATNGVKRLGVPPIKFSDLHVIRKEDHLEVSVKVTNTGTRDGAQVVQVYVGKPDSKVERQKKLLKGFEKVFIPAGQSTQVTIPVLLDDLRYYDVENHSWVLEEGEYQMLVGACSAEENLQKTNVNLKIS